MRPPRTPFYPVLQALEQGYRAAGAVGGKVLLAVSGGADSTSLLIGTARLAEPLRLNVEVASLDHGLRPEAAAEVEGVRQRSHSLGLPFHGRLLGLVAGPGIDNRARDARYLCLEALRVERGLSWIATAHTASDQAETLLMRLARGTSLKGAAGIQPKRGKVIRPMLAVTREQVEAALRHEGVVPVRDPTNLDRAHLRPRVRHDVLPALEQAAGPGVARRLAHFAALAAADDSLLGTWAAESLLRAARKEGGWDATALRALLPPLRLRALALILEKEGLAVDYSLVERCEQALRAGRSATLPSGRQLRTEGGHIRVVAGRLQGPVRSSPRTNDLELPLLLDGPGQMHPQTGWTVSLSSTAMAHGVQLALPRPPASLVVRQRRAGDRLGHRKLQDVLVDRGVPREERDRLPVICEAGGAILWVVGIWPASPETSPGVAYLRAIRTEPTERAGGPKAIE